MITECDFDEFVSAKELHSRLYRQTDRKNTLINNKRLSKQCYVLISVLLLSFTDSNIWSRDIYIPANQDVPYRYLICTVDPMTENVHVRRWETHLNPRQISADHGEVTQIDSKLSPVVETAVPKPSLPSTSAKSVPGIDTFGDINGVEKIDRGWLTTETVFQFKFIRNPFILKQKLKNRLLYVKVRIISALTNSENFLVIIYRL